MSFLQQPGLRRRIAIAAATLAVAATHPAVGQEADSPEVGGFERVDPEADADFGFEAVAGENDLLMFEELGVVVSAARRSQRLSDLAVPVSVVDERTVRATGATRLVDLLRFVPGLDVLDNDRNTVSIGVRGLHAPVSDRTLLLIDGRSGSDMVYGGLELDVQPYMPEDVARVEVVRGPGGAVWGANAFNGVINYILVEPEDVQGFSLSGTINEFGDRDVHLRYGGRVGDDLAYRASVGWNERESSSDATNTVRDSRDFSRSWRVDTETSWRPDSDTRVGVGVAGVHLERGDFLYADYPPPGQPRRDERIDAVHAFARLDRTLGDDRSFTAQWTGRYQDDFRPVLFRAQSMEHTLEAQYDFQLAEHALSLGASARYTDSSSEAALANMLLPTADEQSWLLGAFLIDRWQLSDRTAIEGQVRVDWYSETDVDWAGRAAILHALDDDRRNVLRFAAARAFRIPLFGIRSLFGQNNPLPSPPFPADTFAVTTVTDPDVENETVRSLEFGWRSEVSENLTVALDLFHLDYEDLIAIRVGPGAVPGFSTVVTVDNTDGATSTGGELVFEWRDDRTSARLGLSYADFDDETALQFVRAYRPTEYSVSATLTHQATDDVELYAAAKWSDRTRGEANLVLNRYDLYESWWRLDLGATLDLGSGVTWRIGVEDLFDESDIDVIQIGAPLDATPPGRVLSTQLTIEF